MKKNDSPKIYVLPEAEAKAVFKQLRKKGFRVDLGKSTGNIYTPAGRKITWMMKDFKKQWVIEMMPLPTSPAAAGS